MIYYGLIFKKNKGNSQRNKIKDREIDADAKGLKLEKSQTICAKERGKGLASIEDCLDATIQGLDQYT